MKLDYFFCHAHQYGSFIAKLAKECRVRGIVPWVDKSGGFKLGDHSAIEARRAILEECAGLLFLATPEAFESDFIAMHEIPPAMEAKRQDDKFLIAGMPHQMSFDEMRARSTERFGFPMADFHSMAIADCDDVTALLAARELLDAHIGRAVRPDKVFIQLCSRDLFPPTDDDHFVVNARAANSLTCLEEWNRLVDGLRDLRTAIQSHWGNLPIVLDGSKHLSTAFLFGRVFQRQQIDVRQLEGLWSISPSGPQSDYPISADLDLTGGTELAVTVTRGSKDLKPKVDSHFSQIRPSCLHVGPQSGEVTFTGDDACSFAQAVYRQIEKAMREHEFKRVHLFFAVPITVVARLGQLFAGMPETWAYDFDGHEYLGFPIPGGVLSGTSTFARQA